MPGYDSANPEALFNVAETDAWNCLGAANEARTFADFDLSKKWFLSLHKIFEEDSMYLDEAFAPAQLLVKGVRTLASVPFWSGSLRDAVIENDAGDAVGDPDEEEQDLGPVDALIQDVVRRCEINSDTSSDDSDASNFTDRGPDVEPPGAYWYL